ncbi:MAG: tripartite tricarboxylate transporter substrate-binding protein [bacterium]|nr:tripartite tricarboxylate transporter substrate-binding protein [bacterium]
MNRLGILLLAGLLAIAGGCRRESVYPSRPITMICPWAAGGGTDRVSRRLAMHLEQELGVPVSVVNATGGKGVTGHNRGLIARPDGYTLTMMTFELNTMHWMGLTELSYRDSQPLVSVNEDYAALLVASDAPWKSVSELEQEVRSRVESGDKKLTASGTAAGGAWHLALAGWLDNAGLAADDVVWIPSEGANPSLQQLMSGGVSMVCCSLPEARSLLEAGEVRALGVMSPTRAVGFEDVSTFIEQGRDWTLGGWRGLGVPKNTPARVTEPLIAALQRIVSQPAVDGSFAEFMEQQKFDHTWRAPDQFQEFLAENDRKLGALLQSEAMKSITVNRFSPMAFPSALLILIAITLVGIFLTAWYCKNSNGEVVPNSIPDPQPSDQEGTADSLHTVISFGVIVLAVAAYALLAEPVGFLITAACVVFLLLLWLGTRWLPAAGIVAVFVPGLYFVFDFVLRVPLPRGWLG